MAPLRKPGIDTFFDTSDNVLSYAADVAFPGMCNVNSTALSGRRLSDDDLGSASVDDMYNSDLVIGLILLFVLATTAATCDVSDVDVV